MRDDEAIEGAFQANHKGKSIRNLQRKKVHQGKTRSIFKKEKLFTLLSLQKNQPCQERLLV
jgi:hypothetical protein